MWYNYFFFGETMERVLHIAIGIPSLDMWHADFAISLLGLIGNLKSKPTPLPGYDAVRVSTINFRSSAIAKLRQDITDEALKIGADYLVFIDSDQLFPPDLVRKLLVHGKEVIGCNIAVKRLPSLPTARKFVPEWPETGDIVYTRPESTGLEKIWKLGFGVMMIKASVFEKLKKPYYNFGWNEVTGFVGEDWYFCDLLWKAGIDLWIDHDVSRTVGHVGSYSYTMEDVDYNEQLIKVIRPENEQPSKT
jgi:hypothetical protein